MHFNDREEIIALTPQWKGDRLPDGRPKADTKYLRTLKNKTKNPNGGAVIWGGIRDVEQMKKVENTQVYWQCCLPLAETSVFLTKTAHRQSRRIPSRQ